MTSPPFISDDSRWLAVTSRDRSADLHFVYAVRTTKIYCRPICKARLARRHNVLFFDLPQDAARAGFRACKRCKPQVAATMPEEQAEVKIRALLLARQREDAAGSVPATLGEMAKVVGLSKWHFHRTFKKLTGSTPYEYFSATTSTSAESGTTPESGSSGFEVPQMGSGFDLGLDWNFSEPLPVLWPDLNTSDMSPMDPMLDSSAVEPSLSSDAEWPVSSCDWDGLQKIAEGYW